MNKLHQINVELVNSYVLNKTWADYDTAEQSLCDYLKSLKKDINANFDTTTDGGIDHPDNVVGVEHALKFAEWTGFNLALDLLVNKFQPAPPKKENTGE